MTLKHYNTQHILDTYTHTHQTQHSKMEICLQQKQQQPPTSMNNIVTFTVLGKPFF